MKRRTLTLLLALAMLACVCLGATSCKKEDDGPDPTGVTYELNELGLPVVSEPITLRVMGSKHPIQGEWKDMSLWKWLSEQTGIQFEFDTPAAQGYGEKKNLAFASDNLPDVFIGGGLSTKDELQYGMKQKMLLPLDEYFDVAPNMVKMFETNPDWQKALTMPDGHMYSLPQDFVGFGLYRYSWINKQWLDNLSLEMPKTIDDLYNVLKAFKTGDPNGNGQADELPLSFTVEMYDTMRSTLLNAFGYLSGSYEIKDGKVVFAPSTNEYKEYIRFMNKLWKEGLIDPDSFSQSITQQSAKGIAGKLGMFSYIGDYVIVGTKIHKQYTVLPALTSQYNSTQMTYQTFPIMNGTAAITKENKYPEITMRLLDWFYTETGALSLINGVEGQDWERTEDGGLTFFVPEGMEKEEYRGGKITSDCGTTLPRWTAPAEEVIIGGDYANNAPYESNIHFQVMDAIAPFAKVPMPSLVFTEEEQDVITAKGSDIGTYVAQTESQFIVGSLDLDAEWDSYISTLERMGVKDVLGIYEDAYARWNS